MIFAIVCTSPDFFIFLLSLILLLWLNFAVKIAGDKKAIEKTSQALREGQPKLRQKIVEMGGAAAMESQFGHSGLYPEHVNMAAASGMDAAVMMPPTGIPQDQSPYHHLNSSSSSIPLNHSLRHQHHDIAIAAAQTAVMRHDDIRAMQPPVPDPARLDLHAEMFQRLSLRSLNAQAAEQEQQLMQQQQQQQNHHRMALQQQRLRTLRHDMDGSGLGGNQGSSQLSVMSDFSLLGGKPGGEVQNESMLSIDSSFRRTLNNLASPSGSTFSMDQYSMDNAGNGGGSGGYTPSISSGANHRSSQSSVLHQHPGSAYFMSGQSHQPQQHHLQVPSQYSNASLSNSNRPSVNSASPSPSSSPAPPGDASSNNDNGLISASASSSTLQQPQTGKSGTITATTSTFSRDRDYLSNSNHMLSGSNHMMMDRRNVFAKMKYSRVAGAGDKREMGLPKSSNHTIGDGMPDIHMVESQLSLYSNVSNMTETRTTDGKGPPPPGVEVARVIDHSRDIQWTGGSLGLGGGSRHSIMSGLSRIDDVSIDQSIFSDLSKKIGNVSTRSIAMSEISAIDMQERDNEDDSSRNSGFEHEMDGAGTQHVDMRKHAAMEFDL